jgi:hypothetical protein
MVMADAYIRQTRCHGRAWAWISGRVVAPDGEDPILIIA